MKKENPIHLPYGSGRKIAKKIKASTSTVTRALQGDVSTEQRMRARVEAIKLQRKLKQKYQFGTEE